MKSADLQQVSRRKFLRCAGVAAAAVPAASCTGGALAVPELHEARFYEPLGDGTVQCMLCPWQCVVDKGRRGKCGVRENREGRYYSLVYGRPCTMHNDPIEKKPFFHVYPGSKAFSIATVGCNIECKFCQNWEISQASPDDGSMPFRKPDDIVELALQNRSKTVAYTYTEPTVFCEYIIDCAKAAKDAGLGNVVVSNGFISEKPLKELIPLITGYKVDLKAFTQKFYGELCSGRLSPVLDTLKRLADSGIWFEIVVLVIPTMNDSVDEIKRMAAWIVENLGPDVPLHFTRFHPAYKIRNLPRTPPATLKRARATAKAEGCRYVYTGNMPGGEGENTYCPDCNTCVINRYGHMVGARRLETGKCHACGAEIPGVWT